MIAKSYVWIWQDEGASLKKNGAENMPYVIEFAAIFQFKVLFLLVMKLASFKGLYLVEATQVVSLIHYASS